MGWASYYIDRLKHGETVQFRPKGNSMRDHINSGDLCTVEPAQHGDILVGDVVLCTVQGKQFLHRVTAKRGDGDFQIGNNKGHINGWVKLSNIHGKLTKVEK